MRASRKRWIGRVMFAAFPFVSLAVILIAQKESYRTAGLAALFIVGWLLVATSLTRSVDERDVRWPIAPLRPWPGAPAKRKERRPWR